MAGKESEVLLRKFDPWSWDKYVVSKRLEPIVQWRDVIPLISYRTLITSGGAEIIVWWGHGPNRAAWLLRFLDHIYLDTYTHTHTHTHTHHTHPHHTPHTPHTHTPHTHHTYTQAHARTHHKHTPHIHARARTHTHQTPHTRAHTHTHTHHTCTRTHTHARTHAHTTDTRTHAHTRTHHTPGRTFWTSDQPLGRSRYLHNIQQTKEKNIHVLGGTRTRSPSNQAVADQSVISRGHQGRRNRDIATRLLKCRNRSGIILKRPKETVGE